MYGAIIGDMAGEYLEVLEVNALKNNKEKRRSFEERCEILDENIPLINESATYTDDTVLTIAIADALITGKDFDKTLKKYGLKEISLGKDKYGRNRFGKGFMNWLNDSSLNESLGNGSSMRVSSIGYYFNGFEKVIEYAKLQSETTHNTNDAKNASAAVAATIYLAKKHLKKETIKKIIESYFGYNLNYNIDELRKQNTFSSLATKSVPYAIFCFLESVNFEDAIRKSLSIGGDTDTIAAITGSISEAYYGVPSYLVDMVSKKLPQDYLEIIKNFYNVLNIKNILLNYGIFDDNFFLFIRNKIIISDKTSSTNWGVSPKYKDGKIIDFKISVPKIEDELSIKTNVIILKKAYNIYTNMFHKDKILSKKYNILQS